MSIVKKCVVPAPFCVNTSVNLPNKIFLTVPKEFKRRSGWLSAIINNTNINLEWSKGKQYYICEDHFTPFISGAIKSILFI